MWNLFTFLKKVNYIYKKLINGDNKFVYFYYKVIDIYENKVI